MLITCPACETAYDIERSSLGASGRQVRCARCGENWFASVPDRRRELPAEAVASGMPTDTPAAAVAIEERVGAPPVRQAENALVEAPQFLAPIRTIDAETRRANPAVAELAFEPAPSLVPLSDAPADPDTDTEGAGLSGFQTIEAVAHRADIEDAPARRGRLVRRSRPGSWRPKAGLLLAVLAALTAGLLAGRVQVVRLIPQTAGLYAVIGLPVNLRGLIFEDVLTSSEIEPAGPQPGVPVLVAQGRITNITSHNVDVPRLRFALRNVAGLEVYAWTAQPDRPVLNPGESLPFRTRLASPPADAHTVAVRFFNRHDLGGT